jgi:hypothetical protein
MFLISKLITVMMSNYYFIRTRPVKGVIKDETRRHTFKDKIQIAKGR